jgi:hypothetical protein
MNNSFHCRSHTKKETGTKPKISIAEKKKRKLLKKLCKLFPVWKAHFLNGNSKSIFQHSVTKIPPSPAGEGLGVRL